MENASKALIIAGAILLSILIIALGIYVFNMAKNATNTNQLDEMEISQFNSLFTDYRGNKLGSLVMSLLDKVVNNATTNSEAEERLPDVAFWNRSSDTEEKYGTPPAESDESAVDYETAATAMGCKHGSAQPYIVYSSAGDPQVDKIGSIRSKLSDRHYYNVDFHISGTTGLIDWVFISY